MAHSHSKTRRALQIVAIALLGTALSGCAFGPYGQAERHYQNAQSTHNYYRAAHLFPNLGYAPITSGFGPRIHPVTGKRHLHNGIDLGVPHKTLIAAPKDVIVQEIYHHPQGGLTLKLKDTENGIIWGMCHLHRVLVSVGSSVAAGQLIALSGGDINDPNRGNSVGPHLHLTLRRNGHPIDPLSLRF